MHKQRAAKPKQHGDECIMMHPYAGTWPGPDFKTRGKKERRRMDRVGEGFLEAHENQLDGTN